MRFRWKWRFATAALLLWIAGAIVGYYGYWWDSWYFLVGGVVPFVFFSYVHNVSDRGLTFGRWVSIKWANYKEARRMRAAEQARLRGISREAYAGGYAAALGARRAELRVDREERERVQRQREAERFWRGDWLWGTSRSGRKRKRREDDYW